ncbi:MAG: GNAT family N-acetyltransferase [Clostridia bacterium]|nr:GNAT family N-acetyltransferase [Clostridia bacterium]
MYYFETVPLKNGSACELRNAEGKDAAAFLSYFIQSHGETDYLTTYPDETEQDPGKVAERLQIKAQSASDAEILALVDGKVAGSAGIGMLSDRDKLRHQAEFGISILKEYWRLGIGTALTKACIDCAKKAGFLQLELEVVAGNNAAIRLYEKFGFIEYGRNPRGFRTRERAWQETVLMRLEL